MRVIHVAVRKVLNACQRRKPCSSVSHYDTRSFTIVIYWLPHLVDLLSLRLVGVVGARMGGARTHPYHAVA